MRRFLAGIVALALGLLAGHAPADDDWRPLPAAPASEVRSAVTLGRPIAVAEPAPTTVRARAVADDSPHHARYSAPPSYVGRNDDPLKGPIVLASSQVPPPPPPPPSAPYYPN